MQTIQSTGCEIIIGVGVDLIATHRKTAMLHLHDANMEPIGLGSNRKKVALNLNSEQIHNDC